MPTPDLEGARQYALDRLEAELPPVLIYHSVAHTRDDVVPAVERLAEREGVEGEDLLLLRTAAWYHDLGFVENETGHEEIGAGIARQVLPRFGYSPAQIETICGIILATRLPQTPTTHLQQIMADADLDLLGRDDFWKLNQALRDEEAALGRPRGDEEWYSSQLAFLQAHHYFTPAARELRGEGKARHSRAMTQRLVVCQDDGQPDQANPRCGGDDPLSTEERAAILRAASLFAETPVDVLLNVAALLEPLQVPAGESIFHKGEAGDSMYIIVEGRVRVHDGELTLNHLGPCDVFGEMALLDTEARVASVAAVEDTYLLRLDQVPFQQLMASHTAVALGVIRVLNRRLRDRVRDMAHDFEYMQQMARIAAAAAALETGRYDSRSLDEVGQRPDELGQLARVFQRMADEVIAREERLKQELRALRIQIDEEKRKQQVAEITGSDYFQSIRDKARELRSKK
ncbi:MAG: cyclic nucleotide-binding domain-containing protein [Anaerolineae bacterium]